MLWDDCALKQAGFGYRLAVIHIHIYICVCVRGSWVTLNPRHVQVSLIPKSPTSESPNPSRNGTASWPFTWRVPMARNKSWSSLPETTSWSLAALAPGAWCPGWPFCREDVKKQSIQVMSKPKEGKYGSGLKMFKMRSFCFLGVPQVSIGWFISWKIPSTSLNYWGYPQSGNLQTTWRQPRDTTQPRNWSATRFIIGITHSWIYNHWIQIKKWQKKHHKLPINWWSLNHEWIQINFPIKKKTGEWLNPEIKPPHWFNH